MILGDEMEVFECWIVEIRRNSRFESEWSVLVLRFSVLRFSRIMSLMIWRNL